MFSSGLFAAYDPADLPIDQDIVLMDARYLM